MRRRWVSLGIVFGVVVSLLPTYGSVASAREVASAPAGKGDTGIGTITWGPCTSQTLIGAGAECGMLSVPLDYSRPSGEKIQLAVSRVRHTVPDDEYQGIVLVNPGGPGGSGLVYSVLGQFVPDDAGASYDWIGFDPRGVGASVPALSCDPDYNAGPRPPYDPTSLGIEVEVVGQVGQVRRRLRAQRRPPARAPEDHRQRGRHGRHPPGARRAAAQLLRLLVRHLPGPGVRHAAPVAASAGWCSTPTSTPAGSGTTPTSTRTTPSRR